MKPSHEELLANVARAREADEQAAKVKQQTTDDLYAAIRVAIQAGVRPVEVAPHAGLTAGRIYQIRDGRR